LLHPDKVRRTFKEDAIAAFRKYFDGIASVEEDRPVAYAVSDFHADILLNFANSAPLAVFIATADNRLYEAMLARSLARNMMLDVRVAALLETERGSTISTKVQQRARNYLDASPSFKGDEQGAMGKFAEMLGMSPTSLKH
jgi:hypothetical protein